MGLYIGIVDQFGAEHPVMPQDKYNGGRQFVGALFADGDQGVRKLTRGAGDPYVRPDDFGKCRQAVSGQPIEQPDFWQRMLDVLEANPNLWFDISY